MRRHSARSHSINARNAALRKLATANRLLIAGSVALTGILADVAAASFKGSTRHSGKANAKRATRHSPSKPQHNAPAPAVQPPSQPPSSAEGEREQEPATAPEATTPETSTPEASTSETPTTSEPAPETTHAQEAELAELQREREEAAVSGGS